MPTGTRSSISANSATNPRMATASVLMMPYSTVVSLASWMSSGWKISR